MKISLFSAFYPFRGGIAQFNERLVEELDKEHKVEVFTFRRQYPNWLFPGSSQFVQESDKKKMQRALRIVSTFNPVSYFSGALKIRKSKPELFIANYWMTIFAPFLWVFARRLGSTCKTVLIIHNLQPHEPKFFDTFLNRLILKRFERVVVLSKQVQNDVLDMNQDTNVKLLYHPWYDHFGPSIPKDESRKQLGIPTAANVLLFFGLIRDYKGLDVLLSAFKQLDSSYYLIIAGEFYGNRHGYDRWLNDTELSERILLADHFIPDDQVHLYFSSADVCILPYKSATQSGVTATAFHFGLPALVTDVGGLKDAVGDKGIVVPANDSLLMAEGIKTFFEDEGRLERCKLEIERERQFYSWNYFARELVEFAIEG